MKRMMSKREAVAEMIDGAMRAYEEGKHACAITLACAAEEAVPFAGEATLFHTALRASVGYIDKKSAVSLLNAERDWLKHFNSIQPDEMDLGGSLLLIIRAMSRYHAAYGKDAETEKMKEFFAVARTFDPCD